jgi:hypothetical protein
MAETEKSFDGYLEKLALISQGIDELYSGRKTVIFELERDEFVRMRNILKGADESQDKFKVDISGIEFIYLLNE